MEQAASLATPVARTGVFATHAYGSFRNKLLIGVVGLNLVVVVIGALGLHRGTISAKSVGIGHGSTFVPTLPTTAAD